TRPARSADRIAPPWAETRRAERAYGGKEQIQRGGGERPHPANRSAADRVDGVPAAAALAALSPSRDASAAGGTRVRPLERVSEAQSAAVLLERGPRLAAPLEHGAEIGMDERQVRRAHFHLLELIRRLVEHLELQVDTAERH